MEWEIIKNLSPMICPSDYSANFFANYLEVSEIMHIFAP